MRLEDAKIYEIRFSKRAASYFKRLDRKTKERIAASLDIMAVDPFSNTLEIKPMVGRPEEFRLRVGDYRLIYTVENDVLVVYVLKVYPRGDVYKK